ncbi:ATP-binding protein [Actinacidiphila sp. bgisy167]|uniref:ATP-binding protein n=1 Tax=Actinacidiphila sp. bgisy167 TaxID=3413797 RepID=UPI003D71D04F
MASSPVALRLERRGTPDAPHCQDLFRLPARGSSVADARHRVRARLREWDADEGLCDDAEVIVSELFTNAVMHTGSECVTCGMRFDGARLRLEVSDQGRAPTAPRPRAAGVDEEGGRGLLLVGALSQAWGVRPTDDGGGRVVWAELASGTQPY